MKDMNNKVLSVGDWVEIGFPYTPEIAQLRIKDSQVIVDSKNQTIYNFDFAKCEFYCSEEGAKNPRYAETIQKFNMENGMHPDRYKETFKPDVSKTLSDKTKRFLETYEFTLPNFFIEIYFKDINTTDRGHYLFGRVGSNDLGNNIPVYWNEEGTCYSCYNNFIMEEYNLKKSGIYDESNYPIYITPDNGKSFYIANSPAEASHIINPTENDEDRLATDEEIDKFIKQLKENNDNCRLQ